MKQLAVLLVLLSAAAPTALFGVSNDSAGSTNATTNPSASDPDALFTNSVVAKGKNVSVTRDELDKQVVRIKSALAAQGRKLPADSLTLERQVLENLIDKQLLLAKATPEDKTKGKVQFEVTLQKIKTAGKMTDEQFNQRLKLQLLLLGETKAQWEQQNIEQATIPVVLEHELKVSATDEEARKFYDDNPAKFEQPERVRVANLFLNTHDPKTGKELTNEEKAAKKKEMEGILKKARSGDDFAKLVQEYSEDPRVKQDGGVYTFARGQTPPEIEAAAFSLNTNQVSDIISTADGYHILKLYEKIPARKLEYDKEKADIKDYLMQLKMQKLLPDYLTKLRKAADVQILDAKLNAVTLPPSPSGADSPDAEN